MMFFLALGLENREEFMLEYSYRPEFLIFKNRARDCGIALTWLKKERRRAILFEVNTPIRNIPSESGSI